MTRVGVVINAKPDNSTNTAERVKQKTDNRAVSQAGNFRGVDRVEEPAHILGIENRCFAFGRRIAWPTNGVSRIERNDLPNDQVVEESAKGGQVKLPARLGEFEPLEVQRNMSRFNGREGETSVFAPGEEAVGRTEVRFARVVVFNRGSEELDESLMCLLAERADGGGEEALTTPIR